MAYRARHWACALDILELAAKAASAAEEGAAAAAAGRESGGLLGAAAVQVDDGGAAASWSDWSHQLMAQLKEIVTYTNGTYREHMLVLAAPSCQR